MWECHDNVENMRLFVELDDLHLIFVLFEKTPDRNSIILIWSSRKSQRIDQPRGCVTMHLLFYLYFFFNILCLTIIIVIIAIIISIIIAILIIIGQHKPSARERGGSDLFIHCIV